MRPKIPLPADFLETPQFFGEASEVKLREEYEDASSAMAAYAVAAQVQSSMAHVAKTLMKKRGLKQFAVAQAAGMNGRRLYRLLHGQAWMQVHDISGLSRALRLNLALGVQQDAELEGTRYIRFGDGKYIP